MQAATGQIADALVNIACHGRRDGDRTRTAIAVLNFSVRDRTKPDIFAQHAVEADAIVSGYQRRGQAFASFISNKWNVPTCPWLRNRRLTVVLADALLRAINEDEIVKRQEALQSILQNRKEEKP